MGKECKKVGKIGETTRHIKNGKHAKKKTKSDGGRARGVARK